MLVQTFEDQVRKTPGKIAVKTPGTSLTYEELNARANRLARFILDKVPQAEGGDHQSVGLLFDHGEHMITAVLAVLKAGKCYVPLSPDYPPNRLTYMLSHSESRLILTHSPHADRSRELALENEIGFLDLLDPGIAAFPGENLPREVTGEKSAYIMYTSGSTGHPKGIRQTHENVVYYINNWTRLFSITSSDRMTLFSSFCHDGSGQDMFGALHNGAALYLLNPKDIRADIPLSEFLLKEEITIWHSVPSLYNHFVNTLAGEETFPLLRFILLGGEALRQHEIQVFKKHFSHSTLVNIYGQTESSVNSTWSIRPGDPVEELIIGEPLDNTKIFLIDEEGNAVEPLETGEIIVACPHLSPGYWKDDETTGKVFRHHPELGPLYRTGDLGRLLLDGNIEFIGRKDNQVKIRGFRVELGEIETQLLKHHNIKEAVVRAFETGSNSGESRDIYLCGYVVCRSGEGGEAWRDSVSSELRAYLSARLPDYMIPAVFVQMDRFPLTNSGKVDRKLLAPPKFGSGEQFVAPRNSLEETLLDIWSEVLDIDRGTFGIDDNFFSLGGHSLKAITLSSHIHRRLNARIPLAEMFKNPTVRGFAAYIQRSAHGAEDTYCAVEPAEEKDHYPLTSAQKRLYLMQRLAPAMTGYNVTTAVEVSGEIDRRKLETAFRELIRRHDGFRTSFIFAGGEPVQRIHDRVDFQFSEVPRTDQFVRPFDLSKAPLLRVGLIKTGEDSHVLIVDMHHIITDGLSMGILIDDFIAAYQGEPLSPPPVRYRDYALWQSRPAQENRRKQQETYWLEQFEGELPVVDLPLDFSRPPVRDFEGADIRFEFVNAQTAALKNLEQQYEVTMFMLLLAGLYVLFSKIGAGQPEDIVIGTAVEGRGRADLEQVAGLFINTLALRNYPKGEKPFDQFVRDVRDRVLDAVENQEYPFEQLVEKLSVSRDAGRNPLFDIMFTYQEMGESKKGIPGLTFTPVEQKVNSSNFDIFWQAFESRGKLSFRLRYGTRLFKEETVRRIAGYFEQVVRSVIEDPRICLSEIEILPEAEKFRLLVEFNRTETPYAGDKVLHQLFEEQVQRTPDRTAVTGRDLRGNRCVTLTYRRLGENSRRLASLLRRKGVKPGTIVGLMVERTVEMIEGLWAILKSGGAYIPLDPGYPRERIQYVLRHSGAALLLSQPRMADRFPFEGEIVDIADNPDDTVNLPENILENIASPSNWAYVIYTSGSTGNPKGVVVQHRSTVNFIKGMTSVIPFSPGKTMLALTTISFDIFFLETLLPLTLGLNVVIADEDQRNDPALLGQLVARQQVNMAQVTPSRLQLLLSLTGDLRVFAGVRELMVGGEAFPAPLFKRVKETLTGNIYNMYGPTETTIWSTVKDLSGSRPEDLTIGTPIANTRVYIVDRRSRPVPLGVAGELSIGGDGVAAGYLNNIELTGERFTMSDHSDGSRRFYKTGDLARWLPNGEIEFLGRMDHQVKFRGFRIELEEIEEQLMKHEHIREAVVALKTVKSGEKHLCAYFLPDNGTAFTAPQLRETLSARLPHYMIPSFFIPLEKMPLTANGKIDRKSLPDPGSSRTGADRTYVAPRTGNEKTIARLWEEVLHVESVGLFDNFFDLGGNSMNVIQLNWKLKETFGIDIPAAEMFRDLTIGFLDRYITERRDPDLRESEPGPRTKRAESLDRTRNTYRNNVDMLTARRRMR